METCCKARPQTQRATGLTTRLCLLPVRAYRYAISPLLGPRCRFHPSCSEYAEQALIEQGPLKGTMLALTRLSKCHPWHRGGYDPVPTKKYKPKT